MRTISCPLAALSTCTAVGATACGRRRSARPRSIRMSRGVGRELNAGAGFLEPLGLFQHDDAKPVVRKRKSGGQAADPGPGNDDSARGRQDTPSVGWIRRSHRAGRIPPVSRRRARAPGCADIASSNRDRHARPRRPCRRYTCGWSNGGIGADAHEFLGADFDNRHAQVVVEMRNDCCRPCSFPFAGWHNSACRPEIPSDLIVKKAANAGPLSRSNGWNYDDSN